MATLDEKAQQKSSLPRAGKTAQQVKVLASNPEDLNNPQVPHSGRRKLTPTNCSLTSICMPWHDGGSNPQYPRSSLVRGCSTQQMLFCLIDKYNYIKLEWVCGRLDSLLIHLY